VWGQMVACDVEATWLEGVDNGRVRLTVVDRPCVPDGPASSSMPTHPGVYSSLRTPSRGVVAVFGVLSMVTMARLP
ncbi:hypothetical protein NDU88_004018, partial [Pleurodeles waltl]